MLHQQGAIVAQVKSTTLKAIIKLKYNKLVMIKLEPCLFSFLSQPYYFCLSQSTIPSHLDVINKTVLQEGGNSAHGE